MDAQAELSLRWAHSQFVGLNIFISIVSVQHVLCEQYKVKRIGTEAKCLYSSSPFGLRYCKYDVVALLMCMSEI